MILFLYYSSNQIPSHLCRHPANYPNLYQSNRLELIFIFYSFNMDLFRLSFGVTYREEFRTEVD